jgi:hypothetical protein
MSFTKVGADLPGELRMRAASEHNDVSDHDVFEECVGDSNE